MNPENGEEERRDKANLSIMVSTEEQEEIDKLRRVFNEDLDTFLLDNILMSVQFFDNYDRDITEMRDRCLEETSLESDQFACLQADSLHELVAKNVTFQKKSATNKNTPELIHPLRIFVTYKNVELATDLSSLSKFQTYKKPYYKLIVQKCEDDTKEVSGYVNLIDSKVIKEPAEKYTHGSSIGHSNVVFKNPDEETPEVEKDSIRSGSIISQNDNSYYLEPSIRSKPCPITSAIFKTSDKSSSPTLLPNKCFKKYEKESMATGQRRRGMVSAEEIKVIQKILISTAFKRNFTEVFMEYLWKQMKFDINKWETVTFHYDHITINVRHKTYHVIPVLEMKSCYDLDFLGESKVKTSVKWPTYAMRETIKNSGCSLLPMGYYEASDENNDYTLEWKVIYPKAEKYLTMHMMHTHVKCYLFALTLYKSFIETELSYIHFGPTHILNLLFLMVQKDFLSWPEYNQGTTLLQFLNVLHDTIQRKSLRYFFLHKRNLYANSPLRVLHKAQTYLKQMTENPIAYVLKGLMNLKYDEDFYPVLDYLKLYNILTVENLFEYLYPKVKQRKVKSEKPAPTPGVDTIDESKLLKVTRSQLLDTEILRMFTNHFIEIGHRSRQKEGYSYAMLYFTYAKRLLVILSEKITNKGEVSDLNTRIMTGITLCQKYSQ